MSFSLFPRTLLLGILVVALAACDSSDPNPVSDRFAVRVENVGPAHPVLKSGVFDTPDGASEPGPIMPGESYTFGFTAGPGVHLSLATMFVQSNDLFYAFDPDGLALYDGSGNAVTGDVTHRLTLWDAGTEVNEEPGVGPNQAPRQSGPDTGPAEGGVVRDIAAVDDGYTYPAAAEVIRVTLEHDGDTGFTVTIENVGQATVADMAIPLSPGAWAVHTPEHAFFEANEAASEGIERIAEDGDPMAMADALEPLTGLTVPLSPGAWAVHSSAVALFAEGQPASEGLERIAEDGDPTAQVDALEGIAGVFASGAFDTPVGANEPGPLMPGEAYSFTIDAERGARLSFATMYVQSNDFFYAFAPEGLALFDGSTPVSGDVTARVRLYDAGTEVDEEPGVGRNQAPRQPGPNTGPDEDGAVTAVDGTDDGHAYPPVADIIRVTITPQ